MDDKPSRSTLIDRLRGIYNIPINDGAGPLNGSMTFTREFPSIPIQREAADALEMAEAEIARLDVLILDWTSANLRIVAKCAQVERELKELKEKGS